MAARSERAAGGDAGRRFLSGRSLASDAHFVKAFRQGLSERGYVEGQNVTIEFRWAESQFDRLPVLAADLVGRKVAVIFAGGLDVSIRAMRAAISRTPVVFATGGDPVKLGLVASDNRPGSNATAVTLISRRAWAKRLELIRDMIAAPAMVALAVNPNNPTTEGQPQRTCRTAAQTLGVRTQVLHASNDRDIDAAFEALAEQRANALLVQSDPVFNDRRDKLVALAARYAIPAIYDRREFAAAGGLMSYGASVVDQYRQSGLLRRPDTQGREARRSAGHAADQIRAGDQSQDRQGAGPRRAGESCSRLADEVIE